MFILHIIDNYRKKTFGLTKLTSYHNEHPKVHKVAIVFDCQGYFFSHFVSSKKRSTGRTVGIYMCSRFVQL